MNENSRPIITQVLLVVICILLAGLLATNLWTIRQTSREQERRAYHQEQVAAIRRMADLQDELILNLLEEYEGSAYGSSVDRIAEQQLIAAETQIVALQTLALQNRQIIDLLLLTYEDPPDEASDDSLNEK
ncbi:MAG TPA: hypothetical protein PKE20_01445 [Promineifilum sp.]|nr:hypothetical protein [Promineifilum sp.]